MMNYLIVFVGAGIGGVLRFAMSPAVQHACKDWAFPIGTFSVNMLGCFLIGFLAQLAESKGLFQGETRLFLFVGILGGFTTFSSFGYETFQLLRDGEILYAIANAVLQVVLGLLLVWLGWVIGRLV
ncbi:MAG: fluoride efflux transporter CrcB [Candidatus Obscuribacterales bacterium]|jgi:CrcB protein|nr:fluoride efflux transporter CrcB [Candidatus Obscuribacterales bacterium]